MKTLSLTFLCCLTIAFNMQGQDDNETTTPEQDLFEKGVDYCSDNKLDSGLMVFKDFMTTYPNSTQVARAHYNVGYLNFKLKDYAAAKQILNEILDKPYNDKDANDLMEPYTLYKHHSCRLLAEMALEEKDYVAAERYIRLFDKVYPYQHFCGNEWAAYHMYVATMRARLYDGTNEVQKALNELLPFVFDDGLASNEGVVNEIITMLEKNYSKEATHQEFNRALASLSVKVAKKQKRYSVLLYGVTIQVSPYFVPGDDKQGTERERYEKAVKENALFKRFL